MVRALTTLRDFEARVLSLAILPWLPLMAGGGDLLFAEQETDLDRRAGYGQLTLVFAELTPGLVNWQRGLEGWQMRESELLTQWLDKGLDAVKTRLANPGRRRTCE